MACMVKDRLIDIIHKNHPTGQCGVLLHVPLPPSGSPNLEFIDIAFLSIFKTSIYTQK